MRIELELAQDETAALIRQAVEERRPIDWQAAHMLRRALGLAFSSDASNDREKEAG